MRNYNAIVWLINWAVTDVIHHARDAIDAAGFRSVGDVRGWPDPVVSFSAEGQDHQEELHLFLYDHFYNHYRVARMQEKAKRFLQELFLEYVAHPRSLPPEVQEAGRSEGLHRAICDHIASMTDRRAQGEYMKLFHPFERV